MLDLYEAPLYDGTATNSKVITLKVLHITISTVVQAISDKLTGSGEFRPPDFSHANHFIDFEEAWCIHRVSKKVPPLQLAIIFTYTVRLRQFLWSPYVIGQTIIFLPCDFYLSSSFFFSSPNLSGRRLDVYHTSTHGVTLVRI